jgi:hypothetical protein
MVLFCRHVALNVCERCTVLRVSMNVRVDANVQISDVMAYLAVTPSIATTVVDAGGLERAILVLKTCTEHAAIEQQVTIFCVSCRINHVQVNIPCYMASCCMTLALESHATSMANVTFIA